MKRRRLAGIARTLALPFILATACADPAAPAGTDTDADTTGPGSSSSSGSSGAVDPTTGAAPASTGDDESGSGSGDASTGAAACEQRAVAERGFIPRGESRPGVTLAPCGEDRWYFAAPSESTVEVKLTRTGGAAITAAIAYPDEDPRRLGPRAERPDRQRARARERDLPGPALREFALHVRGDDPELGADYDLEIRCILGCERETTRFPVMFVHGWTGFENIGPLTYFYNVAAMIDEIGFPHEIAVLDPYNHTNVRAGQLVAQIDEALVTWRARKVDLLGHSQGGIDSRCAVSTYGYGDRVSAVMTIASPHRGTYVTDLALGLAPGPVEDVAGLLLNFLGAVTAQQKSDAMASFYSLSEQHMQEEFNPANPDDPRVKYISYTGRTCSATDFLDLKKQCQDLVDPLIGWSHTILALSRGVNDGLVTVESAKWGDYRGEMIADHIDEVGQILGLTDPKFDHLAFYRDRVRELAAEQH
jgi:pimeloyl-ACP methyl ester carboxylesterase